MDKEQRHREQKNEEQRSKEQPGGAVPPQGGFFTVQVDSAQRVAAIIEQAMAAAEPNATLSTPIVQGERTTVIVSELGVGIGVGFGNAEADDGQGGGGGGGGGSFARPVGVVTVTPEGVHYEPILDMTKVGIALVTALGAMAMSWRAMRRAG